MQKNLFKKSMSVLLSVLMLMSCWVWVAPTEAEAAASVGVTTSFTLSPQGNRGSTDWTRLALTGEGAVGGTSIIAFSFSSANVQSLAAAEEVKLKFYAYSCPSRIGTAKADVYYVTSNQSYIDGKSGTSQNATDSGNTILGTTYTGTAVQNSAKAYFGLSNSYLGTFNQPSIDGQNSTSNRTGTPNQSFDVTDIVKEKAEAGESLSFVVMLQSAYNCSASLGWSDIYINSDTISLSEYNAVEEAASLKNAIDSFETKIATSRFYKNMATAYDAYNNAKRYYDAVIYGGVTYNSSIGQTYINALSSALSTYNDTYIDYLNQTFYSRNGNSINKAYTRNLIWNGYDFSWDITNNTNQYDFQGVVNRWAIPNTIIGITNDRSATFPVTTFFHTGSSGKSVRYLIAGSGTSGNVVGTSVFTPAVWRVANSTHTTSGWAAGADGWGDWAYDSSYQGEIKNFETSSYNFALSTNTVYQASTYMTANNSATGVNASTLTNKVDFGMTWGVRSGSTNDYRNGYASNCSNQGYVYAVYMEPYRVNYNNWISIIPSFNYKNYNGYSYNSATQIASNLDSASSFNVNLPWVESQRSGDIISTVEDWATRINNGANYLATAKTNANSATKITTKYVDLTAALSAAESIYKNDQNKYTVASWNAFATAYESARDHMAALDPNGTGNQYSTDASVVGTLATELVNAQNALEYITVTFKAYDGTVLKVLSAENDEVYIGMAALTVSAKAPANTELGKDATHHHKYNWPTITRITDSVVYQETVTSTAHSWSNWVTTKASTCSEAGEMQRMCLISSCGYVETQSIALKDHKEGDPAVENEKAATCDTPGSYDNVVRCTACNTVLSTETLYTSALGHSWNDGEITTPATCTTDGVMLFTCGTCGATKNEVINRSGHSEVTDAAVEATCTTAGKTEGKHCSVCGVVTVAQETVPVKDHSWDEGEITAAPTCTADGVRTYTCTACGETKTEAVTSSGHLPKEAVIENEKDPTCITDGSYDEVIYCSVCDAEISKTTKTVSATGEHVYGNWSNYTSSEHSGKCTSDPACTETKIEAHTLSNIIKTFDSTYHYYKCEKCDAYGYLLNGAFIKEVKEECYGEGTTVVEITGNAQQHQLICKCGNTKTVDHAWAEDTSKRIDSTCTSDGTAYYSCSDCGATKTETLDAGHTLGEWIDEVPATCVATGTKGHYTCSACGKNFDADNNEIDDLVINKNDNHVNTTDYEDVDATCLDVGYTAGTFCDDCDAWISGHEEIPAIAHKNKVHHEKVAATCVAEGTIEYWSCPDCGKNFSDEACTTAVTYLKIEIDPDNHDLKTTGAKAPTCTEIGWDEYVTCQREGCDYTTYVEKNATDHDWGEWTFVSDGKHKRVCANDNNHVETEACADVDTDNDCNCEKCGNLVAHSYGEASCDAPATCEVCGATTGDKLGHDYTVFVKTVDYTCTTDGYDVYKCSRCDSTENKNFTDAAHRPEADYTVMKKATCEADGYKAILCSVCDEELETKTIAKREHVYKDNGEQTKATCLAAGVMNTICTNEETDTHEACAHESTREITQLAHSYTGEYNWDASAKTHAKKCVNGCNEFNPDRTPCDFETVVTDPTCLDGGFTTYTCKDCKNSYTADYISKLGHDYKYATGNGTEHAVTCSRCDYTATESCSGGIAYCNALAVCEKCNTGWGKTNADNHASDETETENAEKATCSAEGYTGDIYHKCCGTLKEKGTAIPKISHKYESYVGNNDATCQKNETETAKCAYGCGEEDTREIADSTVDHKYESYVGNNDATCQKNETETAKCEFGCGKTDTRDIENSKVDHKYESYVENNDATCQKNATETAKCAYGCGAEDTREIADSTVDHKYVTYVGNDDANCQKNETETAECAFGCGAEDTREIADSKVDHKYESYVKNNDATCQKNATETATCEFGCGETNTRDIENSKVDHVYTNYISDNNAECEKDGTKTASCDYGCGTTDTIADEGSALDHIDADNDRKCDRENCDYIFACTHQETYTKEELVAEGTCVAQEIVTVYTYCSDCGDEVNKETVSGEKNPENHVNLVKVDAKAEACEDIGWEAYEKCDSCGYTTYKEIPACGHEYTSVITKEATCSEDGIMLYTCKNDATHIYTKTIPATGHVDNDADGKCDNDGCGSEMESSGGSGVCGCICHKEHFLMKIIYKIVRFFWKLFGIGKSCDCGFVHY